MKINNLVIVISFFLLMFFSACDAYDINESSGKWRQKIYNNTNDSIRLYCHIHHYKSGGMGAWETTFQSFLIERKHEYTLNTGVLTIGSYIANSKETGAIRDFPGVDMWLIDSIKKGDKGCKSLDILFDRSKQIVVRNKYHDNLIDWVFVVEEGDF